MNRIRLLSEQVANQIAAGEVIERPASVVKELVENALDAGAARIKIEIQAGGRSLVRVTDDGLGMSRDDALLCLERHATSKIETAADLNSIATMGFRGEALPSIASVSRMSITTREREVEAGAQVIIHGGKILEVKEAGCAPGTVIEVRSLFYNLPARRKFLRSEETERTHIQHYLTLAALAHPGIAQTFVQDGRVIWQLPVLKAEGASLFEQLQERLRALYGSGLKLLPVDHQAGLESPPLADAEFREDEAQRPARVWGFIGAPGVSRASRDEQHLFVNRRPIESRGLNYALIEGYHTALMKGRFPVCCLFLEIDPAEVDVNVHPAKREVRFRQEGAVRRLVSEAVRNALLRFHTAPQSPVSIHGPAELTQNEQIARRSAPEPEQTRTDETEPARASSTCTVPADAGAAVFTKLEIPEATPPLPQLKREFEPEKREPVASPGTFPASAQPAAAVDSVVQPIPRSSSCEPVPLLRVPLRIVGVIGKLYVVLESDRGLVLLDQHAAHERILFEQTLSRLQSGHAPSQRLLLPETIELSPRDAEFLRENLPDLVRLGVGLSEFGTRTFLLDGLPPFVKAPDARRFVLELVDELRASGDGVNSWRLGEQTIAKTVCRHAVKANDPLSGPELENLLSDLRLCQMPYTCPHGRPTLIEMNYRELEKKFGRLQ